MGALGAVIVSVRRVGTRIEDPPWAPPEIAVEERSPGADRERSGPKIALHGRAEAERPSFSAGAEAEAYTPLPIPVEEGWETDTAVRSLRA